ncbi:Benzoate 4-monooxygenase [Smittium mucronatum]|uniref:Benzoate 4-monooxygenase n=1 Tax=Smittium mucronatum TaxID=133383 RepID=A0A1R0H205_9FUNG|nr:Benzoate 4-monooxygenase [Smittium mucronatum]
MSRVFEFLEVAKSYFLENWYSSKTLYGALFVYGVYKVVYHTFFDQLRDVPGDWISKFTAYKFRSATFSGETTRYLQGLHKKYGPVVRIGPNKVSDAKTSDFKKVMASYRFSKSASYDGFALVDPSIFSTREENFNRERRRQIGPAFSQAGLDSVENLLESICIDSSIKKLDQITDDGNGSGYINYFKHFQNVTADVIGELAFGNSFNATENGGHEITDWVNETMKVSELFSSFPILRKFRYVLPGFTTKDSNLRQFCIESIKKRRDLIKSGKFDQNRIDILQMVLSAENSKTKQPLNSNELVAEMVTMLIAGIDTTSISMSWLVAFIMLYPKVHKKVVDEIRTNFPRKEDRITYKEAKEKLPYFIATVYEVLRIRGSVGFALSRQVPKSGVHLSGYDIPQGTDVLMFIAGAHEDTQVWENPKAFIPERFLGPNAESLKKDIVAFSSGIRVCPGKNLAWMEISMTVGNILKDFDISFPPDSKLGPKVLDPERNNEPKLPADITFGTRPPEFPERDCNIIITKHIF